MTNHTETLGRIVMDMHRTGERIKRDPPANFSDVRDDLSVIVSAVRALAEAVLAIHARDGRDAAQSPGDTMRAHIDTFGRER